MKIIITTTTRTEITIIGAQTQETITPNLNSPDGPPGQLLDWVYRVRKHTKSGRPNETVSLPGGTALRCPGATATHTGWVDEQLWFEVQLPTGTQTQGFREPSPAAKFVHEGKHLDGFIEIEYQAPEGTWHKLDTLRTWQKPIPTQEH